MAEQQGGNSKCVAVFDVGKTNKKLCVFDGDLRLVDAVYGTFDDITADGLIYEPIRETSEWFLDSLKTMAERHPIGAVSFAAHGGAFVCVDGNGGLALPMLSYMYDPGPEFHVNFHAKFGDADALHVSTATPSMPGLGIMGKGIRFAQERFPGEFSRVDAILALPQYYGFLLTGKTGIDYTYIACHTYLWDFSRRVYSPLVDALGVRAKLPKTVSRSWDILGTVSEAASKRTGLDPSTVVAMGIHDSNASLLPYLIQEKEPFTLNSTGTVVVAMHPTDEISISPEDLGKVVYYNLSAFGRPVRTSIFLGGLEFDTYAGLLASLNGEGFPGFDRGLCERMLTEKRAFLLPSLIPFGMFPNSPARAVEDGLDYPFGEIAGGRRPAFFMNKEEAYATLNISLAIQTAVALQKAGHRKGARIFVEGGFRKNDTYTAVLASLFPESEVAVTNLEEATAFGAALLARSALDGTEPGALKERFAIERRHIKDPSLRGIAEYSQAFIEMAGR